MDYRVAIKMDGLYFADDKWSDHTYWTEDINDPFVCFFDTPDQAMKYKPYTAELVLVDLELLYA